MADKLALGWRSVALRDCARWYSGGTPNTSNSAYWDGDIPWITASSLKEFFIRDSERRITPQGLANGSRLVPEGAILFVVRGMSLKSEFRLGIARRPVAFGQDCKALVAKDGILPIYLAYAIRALTPAILGLSDEASHGTGRLQTEALEKLPIPIPPLAEQRAIAHILGALDDKIELNRRMNETLEAIAAALFRAWFVDFEPVRAKAEGRTPAGLSAELAGLFPDAFEDSELGAIPRGWKPGSLGQVAGSPRRTVAPSDVARDTPYIGLEHIPRRSIALSEWGQAADVASGKMSFRRGEILFGKLRPYFHKVAAAPTDGICSTDILVVAPKAPLWFGFVLGHLSSDTLIRYASARMDGTRMPRVAWSDLAAYGVAVPDETLAAGFTACIRPLLDVIDANNKQNQTLIELRDTLLPKLLSGEVRVRDAEHEVGTRL